MRKNDGVLSSICKVNSFIEKELIALDDNIQLDVSDALLHVQLKFPPEYVSGGLWALEKMLRQRGVSAKYFKENAELSRASVASLPTALQQRICKLADTVMADIRADESSCIRNLYGTAPMRCVRVGSGIGVPNDHGNNVS